MHQYHFNTKNSDNIQYTYISWLLKIIYAPLICKQSYKSNTYHSGIRSVHQGFWSPDGVIMNMHIHKLNLIFDILDKYMYNYYSLNIKSPIPVGLVMFSWNSNFLEMLKLKFYKYWWHNTVYKHLTFRWKTKRNMFTYIIIITPPIYFVSTNTS